MGNTELMLEILELTESIKFHIEDRRSDICVLIYVAQFEIRGNKGIVERNWKSLSYEDLINSVHEIAMQYKANRNRGYYG